jgi:hypothetical protein
METSWHHTLQNVLAARPKSKLSISNKLLAYKVILKPIWTYGIQLWGSASISNIEILERFQGKVLPIITDERWYVPNMVLRQDLQITSVKEEIHKFSTQYRDRLYRHPNDLTVHLMVPPDHRRLRQYLSTRLFFYDIQIYFAICSNAFSRKKCWVTMPWGEALSRASL